MADYGEHMQEANNRYEQGLEDGLASRLQFHYERINETKLRVDAILATYDPDDVIMNEVKKLFGKLWVFLFNEDTKEFIRPCPCKKECDF